jgi:hypothetical protein
MNKNKMILTLVGFGFTVAVAVTAQAQPDPDDRCPPSYKLVSVDEAEDPQAARRADKPPSGNKNDEVCETQGKSGPRYVDDDEP